MVAGKWVTVVVQDEPDKVQKPEYKVENRGTFVEAANQEAYSIKISNNTDGVLATNVYIDGNVVSRSYVLARKAIFISEVVSRVIRVGTTEKEVFSPLLFSQPDIVEEGTTLDRTVNSRADNLGVIRVDVYHAIRLPPQPAMHVTCDAASFSVSCTEKEGTKKGAFRSTTALGATERVNHAGPAISEYGCGDQLLESVSLRYGSRAMLLLLGVPPYHFMVNQGNAQAAVPGSSEAIDLTDDKDDDEGKEDGDKKPAAKAVKREPGSQGGSSSGGGGGGAEGGAAKRPKMSGSFFDLT